MEIAIRIGLEGHETKIVENKDTAKHYGSGLANVFATPAMVALMESAAYQSIEPYLPEGYSSVGIQIDVQHKRASLPGSVITCSSVVTNVDGKKVYFNITASDENGEIGTAKHIRYLINSDEFISRLKNRT